uniref:Uncharacterized protein n=1 Tax=Oryza nivara TaxID=4536 RepID=A0A0E0G1E0_ORYNI
MASRCRKRKGNAPVNWLLEIFSTCSGWLDTDEFSSCRLPLRWLKLTSRTTMLPEDISSAGRPPVSELYDRLRCDKLVMPSHAQQSMPFRHDMAMPLSCPSPARNRRRELFSCSRHAVVETAMGSSNSSRHNEEAARPEKGITTLLLHAEWGAIFMSGDIDFVPTAGGGGGGRARQRQGRPQAIWSARLTSRDYMEAVGYALECHWLRISGPLVGKRRLKLTSRTTMLLVDISSDGSPPESKLYDRLSRDKLVSSLRDDEMHPCRPLEASNSSVTAPSSPQIIPSQVQQFGLFCHDTARPPSCDNPARNRRRECLSCLVHESTGEMKTV